MEREDYANLVYVLSSIVSVLIFSICLVIYLMYKEISIYLVGFGLLTLLSGFVTRRFIDKPAAK